MHMRTPYVYVAHMTRMQLKEGVKLMFLLSIATLTNLSPCSEVYMDETKEHAALDGRRL